MSDGSFSFPTLPKPKPLPPSNPLLAGATVTDRSSAAGQAPLPAAQQQQQEQGEGQAMGGTLGKPVVLSRHQRIAPARQKVPFEKGYSQMDWVRLTQTHPDLAGLRGGRPRRDITMDEVRQHNTAEDAWTVLRGKVYNITHYLRFHPGGVPILLKLAGKDATVLFQKYHAWVNADFLLAKCLVGMLAPPSSTAATAPEAPPVEATHAQAAEEDESAAAAALAAVSTSSSSVDLPAGNRPAGQLEHALAGAL